MSDDERATIGARHRTPARGVAIDFDEPVTGNYEGEDLQRMREMRAMHSPAKRIALVEAEQKELRKLVGETREEVAKMSGKLDVLPELISVVRQTADRAAQREHVTFTAKVDVDRAEKLDAVEAKKSKRDLWLKLVAALVTGGGLVELIKRLL